MITDMYDLLPSHRPLPGIETLQIQRCWLPGRGVVLAMRSRAQRMRTWRWLMDTIQGRCFLGVRAYLVVKRALKEFFG